jgi:sulfatase maturation enzyme AslB (radical SAM superfamily)
MLLLSAPVDARFRWPVLFPRCPLPAGFGAGGRRSEISRFQRRGACIRVLVVAFMGDTEQCFRFFIQQEIEYGLGIMQLEERDGESRNQVNENQQSNYRCTECQ